ncbi:Rpn family recombination-promoting nuclease/putative transposase [Sulfurihydrogenibium azorense]|uniref:Rpn family recombination-promoting nuclease/putative transposase n=1 Tax=Sulfurihydrogenibium azorense TaxID=309806 RepID=UPI00031307BD
MSIEKQPHDWFFKVIFSQSKNVESFLEIFLPKIYKSIVPNSLKLSDTEKLSKKYKKLFLDIAFDCKLKDKDGNETDGQIYIVFEHKSYPDKHTPSQISFYKSVMMEEDERLSRPYRPVIPIVFYHGEKPWNIPTKIPQLQNIDDYLEEYTHSLSYILFDTTKLEDIFLIENLYLNACLLSAIYTMKNIFKDLEHLKPILEKLVLEDVRECLYIIIDYTVIVKKDLETIEKVLEEIGGEEKMMTLTEKWKMEGLQEGLKRLIQESQEAVIEILEIRFGSVSDELKSKIKAIEDLEKLKNLRREAVKTQSIEDFSKIL